MLALSLYTAAFVAEAVRSGINSVAAGQAEASRSVGMTFGQTLRLVVLPQAFANIVPPLASVFIALLKNTSIASAFFVFEGIQAMNQLINANGDARRRDPRRRRRWPTCSWRCSPASLFGLLERAVRPAAR